MELSDDRVASPPSKRVKLDSPSPLRSPSIVELSPSRKKDMPSRNPDHSNEQFEGEHCSICLQPFVDRTVIPTCSHEFCFECLLIWTEQSRKCPLCAQTTGDYLIHLIRSKYDYQKHFLTPLRTSPRLQSAALAAQRRRVRAIREREWGRRQWQAQEQADELERAIEKRRWVYQHHLYAKHVASNPYTRYRPFPTPPQFAASPDIISRATVFLRRELRVWVGLDVEFLTTFTLSLMKSLDIRSEPAVRLLAEFLDMDNGGGGRVNAEHFAHELYSYLRSPYRDLARYDEVVQYDVPPNVPPPSLPERSRRWRPRSRSASHSPPRSPTSPRPPRETCRRGRRRSSSPLSTGGHRHLHATQTSPSRPAQLACSRQEASGPSDQSTYADRRRKRDDDPEEIGIHSRTSETRERDGARAGMLSPPDLDRVRKGKGRAGASDDFRAVRDDATGSEHVRRSARSTDTVQGALQDQDTVAQATLERERRTHLSSPPLVPVVPSLDAPEDRGGPHDQAGNSDLNGATQYTIRRDPAPSAAGGADSERRRNAPARPRPRNLLESVQAHLSIRVPEEARSHDHGRELNNNPGALPSSLALSSRGGGGAARRKEDSRPVDGPRPSLLKRLSDARTGSVQAAAMDASQVGPQHAAAVQPASESPAKVVALRPRPAEARHSAATGPPGGDAITRAGSGASQMQMDDGLRALLLSKLEAEKRARTESAAAPSFSSGDGSHRACSRPSPSRGSSDSAAPGHGNVEDEDAVEQAYSPAARAAAEREAQLRSQAQLRVRLAAVNKAPSAHIAGASIPTPDYEGDLSTPARGGGTEMHEEALRNRLMERLRKPPPGVHT